jgi:hypothetical protein
MDCYRYSEEIKRLLNRKGRSIITLQHSTFRSSNITATRVIVGRELGPAESRPTARPLAILRSLAVKNLSWCAFQSSSPLYFDTYCCLYASHDLLYHLHDKLPSFWVRGDIHRFWLS